MDVFLSHHVVRLTIDSGATGSMMRHNTAQRLGAPITSTSQSVHQADLSSAHVITLPRTEDQLWIATDGAVRHLGVGATLYITRAGKLCLSGFYNACLTLFRKGEGAKSARAYFNFRELP